MVLAKNLQREKVVNLTTALRDYLKSKPCLKVVSGFIPERFLRIKNYPAYYNFVADDDVAEKFVSLIKDDLKGDVPVVEANPGLGLITRHLLKAGLPQITVFDPAFHPMPPLGQLINDNPDRISSIPSNFFEVFKLIAQDKLDNGDRFHTMFKDFRFNNWKEEPSLKVVGTIFSPLFIQCVMRSIAFQDVFHKLGRVEYYIALSDDTYKHIGGDMSTAKRLRTYILFNLFFDTELKGEFPRYSFLPWDKGKKLSDFNKRVMYVMKITPKATIYDEYSEEKLKILWYFLQDLCRTKHNKVIAYFERWAPWSGLKLIKEGLSPETEVVDLTVPEILKLFNIFTSLPEFNSANYTHIQESGLLIDMNDNAGPKEKKVYKIGFA